MDFNEEKLEKVVNLLKTQGLSVKPDITGLEQILSEITVTNLPERRYTNKEVNIISPFYNYMSSSMKVLVSLVVVALLAGGATYFKLAGPTIGGEEATIVAGSGDDLGSLLASLDQEQSEETILLATEDVDGSTLADESLLLGEINQTYQNEL